MVILFLSKPILFSFVWYLANSSFSSKLAASLMGWLNRYAMDGVPSFPLSGFQCASCSAALIKSEKYFGFMQSSKDVMSLFAFFMFMYNLVKSLISLIT